MKKSNFMNVRRKKFGICGKNVFFLFFFFAPRRDKDKKENVSREERERKKKGVESSVDPKWPFGPLIPRTFGQVLLKNKNVSIQVAYHTSLGKIKTHIYIVYICGLWFWFSKEFSIGKYLNLN